MAAAVAVVVGRRLVVGAGPLRRAGAAGGLGEAVLHAQDLGVCV
jgi:hypothetical protein